MASLIALCVGLLVACREEKQLSEKLEPLESYLQQAVDEQKMPGAVVLIQRFDGKTEYSKTVGLMDREAGRPLTGDALFRIASMTKPITTVAAMMLVEDGVIGLDEPISTYLPEWANPQVLGPPDPSAPLGYQTTPAQRPITVRHLLTHTSGISYRFMGEPLASLYAQAGITDGFQHSSLTLAEQSRLLASMPLQFEPGTAFHYGLSTDILGHLIEKASGRPLDQFLQERIFTPLGMQDTHFFLPQDKVSRLPALYRHAPAGGLERVPERETNELDGVSVYAPDFHYAGSMTYLSGGAGLVSTAADYARFLRMMANGGEYAGTRLLQKQTVEQMTRNQIGDLRADFYSTAFGFGFAVQDDPARELQLGSVGTYFWGGIFRTAAWVDPEEKFIGLVMIQMWDRSSNIQNDIRARIYELVKEE